MDNTAIIGAGYLRQDGRKGIRNTLVVVYLVECVHHIADEIAAPYKTARFPVHVIGFGGCYPNRHADKVIHSLCTHPNTGAVLLLSLGCESFNKPPLLKHIAAGGRPVRLITVQQCGGTRNAIREGRAWVASALEEMAGQTRAPLRLNELVIGAICGGSDATSGITANPSVGKCFDKLVSLGGTAIFEETGEMIGLEEHMAARAITPQLGEELYKAVQKAARYYTIMGHGSFAPGNADGGLSTIEEKSMGAYSKSGSSPLSGLLKPGDLPPRGGLYLLDVVPDGPPRFGFPNINDNAEIAELMACGCHIILFTTGRGSVVGSAISPVIKICANPDTYARMREDMDIDAGRILTEGQSAGEVADEILSKIVSVAGGASTCSEELGHREFVLTYKSFAPAGPSCLPG